MLRLTVAAMAAFFYLVPVQATAALNTDVQAQADTTKNTTEPRQSLYEFVDDAAELMEPIEAQILDIFLARIRVDTGIEMSVKTMEHLDDVMSLDIFVDKDAPELYPVGEPVKDLRVVLAYIVDTNSYAITVGAGLADVISHDIAFAIMHDSMYAYANTAEDMLTVIDDFAMAFMSGALAVDNVIRKAILRDLEEERQRLMEKQQTD